MSLLPVPVQEDLKDEGVIIDENKDFCVLVMTGNNSKNKHTGRVKLSPVSVNGSFFYSSKTTNVIEDTIDNNIPFKKFKNRFVGSNSNYSNNSSSDSSGSISSNNCTISSNRSNHNNSNHNHNHNSNNNNKIKFDINLPLLTIPIKNILESTEIQIQPYKSINSGTFSNIISLSSLENQIIKNSMDDNNNNNTIKMIEEMKKDNKDTNGNGNGNENDDKLDYILRIAKRLMGDELIEDLVNAENFYYNYHKHDIQEEGEEEVVKGMDKMDVCEFVEQVVAQELTVSLSKNELFIIYEVDVDVADEHENVADDSVSSAGTVIIRRRGVDPDNNSTATATHTHTHTHTHIRKRKRDVWRRLCRHIAGVRM